MEDTEKHLRYVEYKDGENTYSYCKYHRQVSFHCGRENPGVLKKNRKFDEEYGRTIENYTDVNPLVP